MYRLFQSSRTQENATNYVTDYSRSSFPFLSYRYRLLSYHLAILFQSPVYINFAAHCVSFHLSHLLISSLPHIASPFSPSLLSSPRSHHLCSPRSHHLCSPLVLTISALLSSFSPSLLSSPRSHHLCSPRSHHLCSPLLVLTTSALLSSFSPSLLSSPRSHHLCSPLLILTISALLSSFSPPLLSPSLLSSLSPCPVVIKNNVNVAIALPQCCWFDAIVEANRRNNVHGFDISEREEHGLAGYEDRFVDIVRWWTSNQLLTSTVDGGSICELRIRKRLCNNVPMYTTSPGLPKQMDYPEQTVELSTSKHYIM